MKKKMVTLEQVGYRVYGMATINLWGGGQGTIEITPTFIPIEEFSKRKLCGCINDGGFGCESIESVELDVFRRYVNPKNSIGHYEEFNKTICTNSKHHLKYAYNS